MWPDVKQELDTFAQAKRNAAQRGECRPAEHEQKSKSLWIFWTESYASLEQEKLHLDLELKKAQSSSPDEFWQRFDRWKKIELK